MILQLPGERHTIYTNIHATFTSHIQKYLLKNSFCQNKVRTPFNSENFALIDKDSHQNCYYSEDVDTSSVNTLRSLHHDRLYINMHL